MQWVQLVVMSYLYCVEMGTEVCGVALCRGTMKGFLRILFKLGKCFKVPESISNSAFQLHNAIHR